MYLIDKETTLDASKLSAFINDFEINKAPKLRALKKYYMAENPTILGKSGSSNSNYKVAHGFAATIVDTHVGYFMGSPVHYNSTDENAAAAMQLIGDRNDEESQNLRLAQDSSIYGFAHEIMYIDAAKNVRFKDIDPRKSFVIYENNLDQEPLYFVRFYKSETNILLTEKWVVEVLDSKNKRIYETVGGLLGNLNFKSESPHGFTKTPIAVYNNNRYRTGDFEKVIPMIDAYDSIASNTLNDLENFADAYLVFKNVDIEEEDMVAMRESKTISFTDVDGTAEVSWLTKDVLEGGSWNGAQAKLEQQIFTMTGTPQFTDENFAGNSSGVALKYKTLPLEQKAASKEREFRRGLQRRIELINDVVDILLSDMTYLDIEITFKRTLPIDILGEMQAVGAGHGLVPQETLLGQVSFIDDPAEEVRKLKEETEISLDFNLDVEETE